MSEYEIGKDIQELRARVTLLENVAPSRTQAKGVSEGHRAAAGLDPQARPLKWKLTKGVLPPLFTHGLLGIRPGLQLDDAESQTWTCVPEPLILNLTWASGATDEYCRFVNQSFTLLRYTDPNTHVVTARYSYAAQLVASGKAHHDGSFAGALSFAAQIRDGAGGVLFYGGIGSQFWVECNDNRMYGWGYEFNPALYDLIKGVTWQIVGWQSIAPC
jgi:hypothetical protein